MKCKTNHAQDTKDFLLEKAKEKDIPLERVVILISKAKEIVDEIQRLQNDDAAHQAIAYIEQAVIVSFFGIEWELFPERKEKQIKDFFENILNSNLSQENITKH